MKKIIFLIMLLCISSIAYSDWCYQEFANESNSCGAVGGGYYNVGEYYDMIDGNYDTYYQSFGDEEALYFVYNVNSSTIGAFWQIKEANYGLINYSLTDNCLFNNNGTLKIKYYKTELDPIYFQEMYCLDQNDNLRQTIRIQTSTPNNDFYEEGMFWYIDESPNLCYQEFANQSNECNNVADGYYDFVIDEDIQYYIDGDWTTTDGGSGQEVRPVVYKKPENVIGAKYSHLCTGDIDSWQKNFTLNQNCIFNTNDTIIIESSAGGNIVCKNSTGDVQQTFFINHYNVSDSELEEFYGCSGEMSEEGMFWSYEDVPVVVPPTQSTNNALSSLPYVATGIANFFLNLIGGGIGQMILIIAVIVIVTVTLATLGGALISHLKPPKF